MVKIFVKLLPVFVVLFLVGFICIRISAALLGDTNNDGKVNGIDYVNIIKNFGKTTTGGPAAGDVNNDGVVNSADLNIVVTAIVTGNPITTTPSPIPSGTPSPSSTPIAGSGQNYYVDINNGNDSNAGTINAPWKTIQHAIGLITPGSTVNIRKGIYILPRKLFMYPGGPDADHKTTFKAYQNADGSYERAILTLAPYTDQRTGTTFNGYTPSAFYMEDNMRLQGLMIGGARDADSTNAEGVILGAYSRNGNTPLIAHFKDVVDCTFFGGNQSIVSGSLEGGFVENNNVFLSGGDMHSQAVYLSGQDNAPNVTGVSNNNVVDHNVFVGTPGTGTNSVNPYGDNAYAIQTWHDGKRSLYSRNFIAGNTLGIVAQDSDMFLVNNMFYKFKTFGPNNTQGWGLLASSSIHSQVLNNVFGPSAPINDTGSDVSQGTVLSNNAFDPFNQSFGALAKPAGANQIMLSPGNELTELGYSTTDMDNTVVNIRNTFTPQNGETNQQMVTRLLNDPNVDIYIRHIRALAMGEADTTGFVAPLGTILKGNGINWFGQAQPNGLNGGQINLGPISPAPGRGTYDDFINAFNTYGPNFFKDWDRCDNSYTPGQTPICP